MMGLPDGQKSFKIGLAVLIQYWCVTDTQPRCRIYRAMLRVARVKTRMMGLPGQEISLMISLALWIQYMNVTDRQVDIG